MWSAATRARLPDAALDENLCEQVFVNLVQNAYDAMSETGGTLRISIAAVSRAGPPWR